jgi:hypothetical protein
LTDLNQWSGQEKFTAIGKVDGQDLAIDLILKNTVTNTLSIDAPSLIQEGTGKDKSINISINLANPASEDINVKWSIQGVGEYSISAADFSGSVLPSGSVSFGRGDSAKIIKINLAGDSITENNENMRVSVEVTPSETLKLSMASENNLITVIDDDLTRFYGTAVYWKNSKPITLNSSQIIESSNSLTSDQSVEVKSVKFDPITGLIHGELWLNTNISISNFNLQFNKPSSSNFSITTSDQFQSWLVLKNQQDELFDIAAIGNTGIAGPVKIFEFTIDNISGGQNIQLTRGVIGSQELSPQKLFSSNSLTINNGLIETYSLGGAHSLVDGISSTTNSVSYSIDSRDALMALKMANKSISIDDLEDAVQFIAADVDKSGQVNALDSWLILREIVGLGNGKVGEWQLINNNFSRLEINSQHAWDNQLIDLALVEAEPVELLGIIRGDVDGSWGN